MRIFSRKALQFDHPAGQEPAVVVQPLSFADVPDWVKESAMFKWANSDGDVEVTASKQDEAAAESGESKAAKAASKAAAKAAAEEEAAAKAAAEEETRKKAEEEAAAAASAQS